MIKFQSFLSSSSGNATLVTDDHVHLLVDCGANGKYITECLRRIGVAPQNLSGILITHEHRDHIAGAGILSRRFDIPIYATKKTWEAIGDTIGNIADHNRLISSSQMNFGSLTVCAFSIPHDAADPVGYSFKTATDKFTIATDIGHVDESLIKQIAGSSSVIIEANHDMEMLKNGLYPFPLKKRIMGDRGHLSNAASALLCAQLAQLGTKAFWLGHLSTENNRPELAYKTVWQAISQSTSGRNSMPALNVLPKYWISE